MVAYPNENKICYGIVVGGNDSDPDPTMSGGCRIYIPSEYGKDVDIKHLPFSRLMGQGTQEGITRHNPPPEHGSAVMVMKMGGHSGTGHLTVLGTVPNDINRDATIPGNSAVWPAINKAIKDVTKILIPPNIGSGPSGSKPPKEKGKNWAHELAKGIPSTTTLYPMNGISIPQMTNVTTAIQAFSSILSGDLLSKMPGMNMSLGGMFEQLAGDALSQITSKLSPEMSMALTSMSTLMQSMEFNETGGFNTATKVDLTSFIGNAVELLSDTKTIYDMIGALQRLQSDSSLAGLDKLGSVSFEIDTPFGKVPMQLDATGAITSLMPDGVQKLIDAFSTLMSTGSAFPGVFPDVNMFGKSSQVMNNMFQRLPGGELAKAVTQMQQNVAPGTNMRFNTTEVLKTAMKAGDLGLDLLKKMK